MRSTDQAGALLVLLIAGLSVFAAIARAEEPGRAVRGDEGPSIQTLQALRVTKASHSILPSQERSKLHKKIDGLQHIAKVEVRQPRRRQTPEIKSNTQRANAERWEDWGPQCGSGFPDCASPLKCTQRANTKCGPESGCPGECTLINQNGRRTCLSLSATVVTGPCPAGFHCKIFDRQNMNGGGECLKGVCREGELSC